MNRTMQDLNDDERKQVLGEVLMDELKAIREGIADLPTRQEFKGLEAKVDGLADDVTVLKAAVTDQGKELRAVAGTVNGMDQRLGRAEGRLDALEAA